jgi:hypothetical protein
MIMAKNTKERQQEYRDRQRLNSVDRRLNLWINSQAYCALERLSDHFRITKREVIEQLIVILDSDVTKIRKLDPSEWDEYSNEKALRSNE